SELADTKAPVDDRLFAQGLFWCVMTYANPEHEGSPFVGQSSELYEELRAFQRGEWIEMPGNVDELEKNVQRFRVERPYPKELDTSQIQTRSELASALTRDSLEE